MSFSFLIGIIERKNHNLELEREGSYSALVNTLCQPRLLSLLFLGRSHVSDNAKDTVFITGAEGFVRSLWLVRVADDG